MISLLTGKPDDTTQNPITILTSGGVGYSVSVPEALIAKLTDTESITVYIHTHVREDALELFGFHSRDDLRLFKLLITVSGIGPKTALAVMNKGSVGIKKAIASGDISFFSGIARLGKKNAQKIIIELRSKMTSGDLDTDIGDLTVDHSDIIDALIDMGFSRKEISTALASLPDHISAPKDQIRYMLKLLGKHTTS